MIRSVLAAPLWRQVEEPVNPEELFAAAGVDRIGVKDLAGLVPVEDAVARKIFDPHRPFRRWPEIVQSTTGSNLLGLEGNIEVVVEVAVVGRHPGKAPAHSLADGFDF